MSATLLYWKEEEVFQDSADVIAKTLGLETNPIVPNEWSFLRQVENEGEFLYLLSHGLPDKGFLITGQDRVTWDKIASRVRANILIVDSCFSGQILEQTSWVKKPAIIITSTAKDNYSYNPVMMNGERMSLLAAAMNVYFSDRERVQSVGEWLGMNLTGYNEKMDYINGIDFMLRGLKYMHLQMYAGMVANEEFVNSIKTEEDRYGISFKGFSSIRYEING